MNLLDTSAWIEILAGGPHADLFLRAARDERRLLVPATVVAEVLYHVHAHLGDDGASEAVAALSRGIPVPLTTAVATEAALAAERWGLSLRSSLVYAQARASGAKLWTLDESLRDLPRGADVATATRRTGRSRDRW